MRRLRLTIDPGGEDLHPVGDVFFRADYVDRAELWNWNVREAYLTLLFVVYGDRRRVEAVVEDAAVVLDHELLPVDERCFYLYLVDEGTDHGRTLFERFTRPGILAIPPATWADGTTTMTVVADGATLQSLVDDIPPFVDVEVEAFGEYDAETPSALSVLSPRQREALAAGVETGYYDVPRSGSHEDVAELMDCAPSTAAEHLQKAEARLVRALFQVK